MRRRWYSLAAAGLLAAITLVPAAPALAAPAFKVPFPCGQSWSGQTRSDHSPAYAIDFNRTDDLGDPVVASAPGTVDRVTDLGGSSYGKYVAAPAAPPGRTCTARQTSPRPEARRRGRRARILLSGRTEIRTRRPRRVRDGAETASN